MLSKTTFSLVTALLSACSGAAKSTPTSTANAAGAVSIAGVLRGMAADPSATAKSWSIVGEMTNSELLAKLRAMPSGLPAGAVAGAQLSAFNSHVASLAKWVETRGNGNTKLSAQWGVTVPDPRALSAKTWSLMLGQRAPSLGLQDTASTETPNGATGDKADDNASSPSFSGQCDDLIASVDTKAAPFRGQPIQNINGGARGNDGAYSAMDFFSAYVDHLNARTQATDAESQVWTNVRADLVGQTPVGDAAFQTLSTECKNGYERSGFYKNPG